MMSSSSQSAWIAPLTRVLDPATVLVVVVAVLVDVVAVEVEVKNEMMLYMMNTSMTTATKTCRTRWWQQSVALSLPLGELQPLVRQTIVRAQSPLAQSPCCRAAL
eukprot:3022563-Pyramimonas_sp.AAC.1